MLTRSVANDRMDTTQKSRYEDQLTGPEIAEAVVDIRTPAGKRWVKVLADAWICHYGITKIKADEDFIIDTIFTIQIFANALKLTNKKGVLGLIRSTILAEIIGNLVLARGISSKDHGAIDELRSLCSLMLKEICADAGIIDMNNNQQSHIIEEAIRLVIETLSDSSEHCQDEAYEVSELPLSIDQLAEVCLYEAVSGELNRLGYDVTPTVEKIIQEKENALRALIAGLNREGVKGDRIWNLLNAPMYCNCIKGSFLILKPRQRRNLAFRYYDNQRVSDSDVMEILEYVGELQHKRGNRDIETNPGNFSRNMSYILETALPQNLKIEFATAMQRLLHAEQNIIPVAIRPYIDHNCTPARVRLSTLMKSCQEGVGTDNGRILINEELIKLCRALNPKDKD